MSVNTKLHNRTHTKKGSRTAHARRAGCEVPPGPRALCPHRLSAICSACRHGCPKRQDLHRPAPDLPPPPPRNTATHINTHARKTRQTGTFKSPECSILVSWTVKQDEACSTPIGAFLQEESAQQLPQPTHTHARTHAHAARRPTARARSTGRPHYRYSSGHQCCEHERHVTSQGGEAPFERKKTPRRHTRTCAGTNK